MRRDACSGRERSALEETAAAIARVQLPNGCIPWDEGGHADPWNHVEAAMGVDVAGYHGVADAAYRWLAATQRSDGAWNAGYKDGEAVDPTLDANFCAYVATGCWHHYVVTGDELFLFDAWPMVERAIDFTLELQTPGGEVLWARDAAYSAWPGALLTSSSSIHLSLGCAIRIAEVVGVVRPDWDLSLLTLGQAVVQEERFESKDRFAMDWYYPVLGGVLSGDAGRRRLLARWHEFVVEGWGVRCVSDRPWVTTGESAELVLALARVDLRDEAHAVFDWLQRLRTDDGAYWTGTTFPDGTVWPRECPTWGSGAVLLAADALEGVSRASSFFRQAVVSEAVGDAP